MALVRIDKNNLWFRIHSRKHNADKEALIFGRYGEFSPTSDIAFKRHLVKLSRLNNHPHFQSMNGDRVKSIRQSEPLWY